MPFPLNSSVNTVNLSLLGRFYPCLSHGLVKNPIRSPTLASCCRCRRRPRTAGKSGARRSATPPPCGTPRRSRRMWRTRTRSWTPPPHAAEPRLRAAVGLPLPAGEHQLHPRQGRGRSRRGRRGPGGRRLLHRALQADLLHVALHPPARSGGGGLRVLVVAGRVLALLNRISTYIERHERTCARIFGLTFVAGYFVS